MREVFPFLLSILVLIAAAGCATTDDPRQGGLFGYNPAAYERRAAERQAKLDELQQQNQAEQQKTEELQQDLSQKQLERDAQAERLAEMDRQVVALENKLARNRPKTGVEKQQHSKITNELKTVREQVKDAKGADSFADEAAKRKEIDRLNAEIDRLLREADALSSM